MSYSFVIIEKEDVIKYIDIVDEKIMLDDQSLTFHYSKS